MRFLQKFGAAIILMILHQNALATEPDWDEWFDYAVIASGGSFYVDEELVTYVDDLFQELAQKTDPDRPYKLALVNSDQVDIWSLPGGNVGVTRQALLIPESKSELAALLARELHHAKQNYDAAVPREYRRAGFEIPGLHGNYAIDDAQIPLHFLAQKRDRIEGLQADLHGQNLLASLGYDPRTFVDLLVRMLEQKDDPDLSIERHDISEERVERVTQNVARIEYRQGDDWQTSDRSYAAIRERLAEISVAYDAAERSLNILPEAALVLIDQSIEMLPGEASFYSAKAQTLTEQSSCRRALGFYDQALAIDATRYDDYFGKAECFQLLGDFDNALKYFEMSDQQLPNAASAARRAQIQANRGDTEGAKQQYVRLLSTLGALTDVARRKFVEIDLYENPQIYFLSQSFVRDGELTSVITNQSGLSVSGIDVEFAVLIGDDDRATTVSAGYLAPGGQVQLYPGWYVEDVSEISKVHIRVIAVKK